MTISNLEAVIIDRLIEAAIVAEYTAGRAGPSTRTGWWPETSTSERDQWATDLQKLLARIPVEKVTRQRRPTPSAAAISRMDETLKWLAEIGDDDARKAVALKVHSWVFKVSSTKLAARYGFDRRTLNRRFNRGIEKMMVNLCKEDVFPNDADDDLVSRFRPNQGIQNRNIGASAA